MARTALLIITVLFLSCLFVSTTNAQSSRSYELLPAPDLWYNDVDGIRLGIRLKGQVPGTFEDGPHRLDGGVWLSTWIPELPVSYYLSYTEPIPRWSDFGSEASAQAISSIRTGYSRHGLGINKRWQQGFDEQQYREISFFTTFESRFDDEYTAFPSLWSDRDHLITSLTAEIQKQNSLGRLNIQASGGLQWNEDTFSYGTLTAVQRIPFNDKWGIRVRGFAGSATKNTSPEFLFSRSTGPAIQRLRNGVTRAKGTIPQPWMESGNLQIAGGANLRGYTSRDVQVFSNQSCVDCETVFSSVPPNLHRAITAFNAEFDYPNPVGVLFNKIPYASDFIDFRSYVFADAGSTLGSGNSSSKLTGDAGAGFSVSLNIPDYLGKPRGFVLRYEIPFWLSDPQNGDSFSYRSLVGFGAVISF